MSEKRDIEIRLSGSKAESAADRLNNKVKGIGSAADGAESSMSKLTKVATAVGAALATAQIQRYADAWTNVNNRLNAATSTQAEFIKAQKGVISIAQQAGVDISGVADSYARLAQSTSELGISQDRVLKVTKNVALALKAGGATAQEVSSIAVQLGQGLGAGALQGDELRSVLESSIPIAKALAKEFNTTTGELKTLGANGELTASRVVSALENMDEKALTFTKDISGGFTEVSNALTVYVGGVDESLGVTEKITGSLTGLANNLDTVIDGVTTIALLIGAKYVGSLTSAIASQALLTASGLRATVQMNALGQVTSRTTVAMNVGAVAAKGLSASLAFIGGPIGLAVIAAAGLYTFVDGADSAKDAASEAADEINILANSFSNLSKNRKATLLNETETEMAALSSQLVKANEQLNTLRNFSDSPAKAQGIKMIEDRVRSLNNEMDSLSNKQAALIGTPDLSDGTDRGNINNTQKTNKGGSGEADTKAFDSLKARLQLETQAIQAEAEVRRAFAEGQINQQQLDEELALQGIYFNYEARRVAITENIKLNDDQKKALLAELAEQEILAEQAKQDQLSEIVKQETQKRIDYEKQAADQTIGAAIGLGTALLKNQISGNAKSEKEKKSARKKGVYIDAAAAIIKNFYTASNFYEALGQNAVVAGAALTQISNINSAASSGYSPSSTGVSSPTAAAPSIENQQTNKTINIVGLENFGPNDMIPMTRAQFESYLGADENVNIAINNGQSNASRIGAI